MSKKQKNIRDAALLGSGFYLLSTCPGFAYLDPGSGSMLLTAILGVLAATTYTLRGYFYKVTRLFRRDRSAADGSAGRPKN
jgi:hypothetical protein